MQAFLPVDGSTVVIAASGASARGQISKQPTGRHQLRIANMTAAVAYYKLGDSTVTATTANAPLPAGAIEVITVPNTDANPVTHCAVILSTGTGNVSITTGHGL